MTQSGRARGGATAQPGEPLEADDPVSIGRYVLDSRLGSGGMGTVFLGRDTLGRRVAVKVIRPELAADPDFRARFRHEVAAARRVSPFCTASVLDADPEAYQPYLVTEYIEGPRLDQVVTDEGPLPPSTLTGTAIGVATALTAIHRAGIVHRDLKPANVIMSLSGPRVIDFGIAKPAGPARHALDRGLIFGTYGWMAPEQILDHPVGFAADIFIWGLLVAYAGTGRHPFVEPGRFGPDADADLGDRLVSASPDLAGLTEPLRRLVERALTKDPAARPSARDLLLRLVDGNVDVNASTPIDQVLGRTQQMAAVPPPTRAGFPTFAGGHQPAAPSQFAGPAGGAAPPHAWPPQPVPYPPQPPATLPRRSGRRWLLAVPVLVVLLLLGWILLSNTRRDDAGAPTDTPRTPAAASPSVSVAPTPGVGVPVRDGQLEFTVTGSRCVNELDGLFTRDPDGQYCLVDVTVSNVGDSTRNLSVAPQNLYDTTGAEHRSRQWTSRIAFSGGLWENISPGETVRGTLVFDIPVDATPQHVELHDGPLSQGATVALR